MVDVKAIWRLAAAAMVVLTLPGVAPAQAPQRIKLNAPDLKRGLLFMEALSVKASAREWSDRELSLQDLSDLLWAANGINRPAERKFTASSAMNAHDVDVYAFMKDGVYLYDADSSALNLVVAGDYRSQILPAPRPRPADTGAAARPAPAVSDAPIQLVLVSNSTRFRTGSPEQKYEFGALDAGIVSQNISLFCAATGLKTRPRASMNRDRIRELLKLDDAQHVFLNHPVGYAK
jgi:SagB-type dehydrogenase family enzyme